MGRNRRTSFRQLPGALFDADRRAHQSAPRDGERLNRRRLRLTCKQALPNFEIYF